MTQPDKKEVEKSLSEDKKTSDKKEEVPIKEEAVEDKLKAVEEKLLRTLADMENQRRRLEKERQEAFDYGGYNFARES